MINATSIGLHPRVHDRLDVDIESLKPGMVVADVIPNPPRTHFIKDAEARGIPFLLRLPTVPLYSANQQFSFVNHFFGQALMQIEEKFFVPHHF